MRVLLVVYDNDSYIHWFPQATAHIAAALRQAGHEVAIWSQDLHHWPDADLTAHLDRNAYDVVGLGVIAGYYQFAKMLSLAEAINRSRQRPFFVLGGHGPTPEPAYFMARTGADAVVMGEGEITVVALLAALESRTPLERVEGLAYRDGGTVRITPPRPLVQDIDTLPWPAYDLFDIHHYRLLRMPNCRKSDFILPLLSGRGCTFRCNFCYRMDKGFRPRATEAIVEEIRFLKRTYGISYIAFSDELLMSSEARTEALCRAFIAAGLNIRWDCNGRLNYAKPDLLRLMREAGCVFINYGIEAMDDEVLRRMHKGLRVEQIHTGVENTLAAGISPGLNMLFGHLGDTPQTLDKAVEFLLKYDDGAQLRTIRPVTPYPGSPLYDHAIKQGLLGGVADFYENRHLNSDLLSVNFTGMSDAQFYQCLSDANVRLLEHYYERQRERSVIEARRLYAEQARDFRGFRQS